MNEVLQNICFYFNELHDKLFLQPEQPENLIFLKTWFLCWHCMTLSRDSHITTIGLGGETCPSPKRSQAKGQHYLNSQENQGKPFQCISALRHPLSMQNRHHFHAWALPIPLPRINPQHYQPFICRYEGQGLRRPSGDLSYWFHRVCQYQTWHLD